MNDLIVFRATGVGTDAPRFPSRGKQHLARRRAGLTHALPFRPRAGAAAGHLDAVNRVIVFRCDGRRFVAHFVPIRIKLLGDHHRDARVRSLSHFRVIHDHRNSVVLANANEGVQRKRRCSLLR